MTRSKGTRPDDPAPSGAPGSDVAPKAEVAPNADVAPNAEVGPKAEAAVASGESPHSVSVPELADRVATELETLGRELAEIDMLVVQTRTEAARHETRRAQGAERLSAAKGDPKTAADAAGQLVTLTKRATVMEAQVEVLEGKQRSLARMRDSLASYAGSLRSLAQVAGETWLPVAGAREPNGGAAGVSAEAQAADLPPAISRVVLAAQEDLRREIARAMHDGPAQSLTNIVLQAQIVEHLLDRDPALARSEVGLLIGMVQQTLDATKSFIFDVRPMVLDDLGLVPTLRRAAQDRGRRAGLPVAFDSVGQDRRLGVDVESGLFRIVDEALVGYLERRPDRVSIQIDWETQVRVDVVATRVPQATSAEDAAAPIPGKDVPPALAAMIEDRRAQAKAAAPGPIELPTNVWREIQGRARTIGATADLLDDGGRVVIEMPLPEDG